MCIVLVPLGVNPIAVNKYIISYQAHMYPCAGTPMPHYMAD